MDCGRGTRVACSKGSIGPRHSGDIFAFWNSHSSQKAVNEFLNQSLDLGHHHVTVLQLLEASAVLVIARIVLALARRGLRRASKVSVMDEGKKFILRRLLTSVVWTVALMLMLSLLGVDLTALWAGSAALLVGVGIGLQGFFNDVVSGFVLLFEGGVAVGNVLAITKMLFQSM